MKSETDCEQLRKLLPDLAVGGLSGAIRTRVERHAAECETCALEMRALQRTGQVVDSMAAEPAPDLWNGIRANLKPREETTRIHRAGWWLTRNWVRSGLAAATAGVVVLALLLIGPEFPDEVSAETYMTNHASMSWRDPFADKAALGLTATMPVDVSWEETK